MNTRYIALKAVCASMMMILPLALFGQSPQDYSWSISPPNVASVSWTNQQIGTFLGTVTDSVVPVTVSDFEFTDLDSDGQLELIASVDFSGRRLFNTIVVVRKQVDNFAVQQIAALGVQTVHGAYADLNQDGREELLVPTAITPYLGASAPQATWTAIYGWNGPLLVDMSTQFSAYYQNTIVPVLRQVLDNLQETSPGTIQVDIGQIEYDKALRVSGLDPTAGLAQALTWGSSGDSTHRIFAAAVLADIGTQTAINALNTLTTDPDSNVSIYARAAVQSLPDLHFSSVQIEIKPGSTPAPIRLSAQGSIPVAILSTPTFNAPQSVNIQTLTFGSSGTEKSLLFCNANGEDVNNDGLLDLVCHFDAQASSFQSADAAGTLKGKLEDGTSIRGTAPVVIVN